jgi:2-polyprenyl-3-methyl-5-hydroxy-6-metoxy-1,4-benzoquinol methylase
VVAAALVFADAGCANVVDLGAGHGRDSTLFARHGFTTYALDVSDLGLAPLDEHA